MIKKVMLAVLLVGIVGVMVWGGVIRTQAKSGEVVSSSQSGGRWGENGMTNSDGNSENSGSQIQRGNDHEGDEDCNESDLSEGGFYGSLESGEGQGTRGNQDDQSSSNEGQGSGFQGGKNISSGNSNGRGGEPLDESEIEALFLALDDEYHALAMYQSVISKFGEIEPFVEIAQSEQRHINALVNQFTKHGISVLENTWLGNISPLDSVQSACQLGVEAEIANVDLYQKLFSMVDDPRLIQVFTNLSNASQESHLPAFQECQ